MKRIIKSLAFIAVAAMGLTACQNDIDEQIEAKESVVVTFVADSAAERRTSVDTSGDVPVFAWDETESFAVLEQTTALAEATNVGFAKDVEGKATITATFDHNAGQSEYKYVAVYPKAGYVEATSIATATLSLPANQTMGSASYDPNADLMVSKVVATAAQPIEVQPMQFTRLAAVAKISIKGVEGTIEKVIFTAEGKTIAGTITADLENIANEDGSHNFDVAQGSDSITIEGVVNNGAVYFTLLPTTLEAGEGYTVTVVTEDKIYVKKGTIPEGKSLEFAAGMVTRFGVNMEGVTPGDKWVLVRDVDDLEAGDIVTFVSKNYNWVMGKWASSYPYASYTEVVKIGDYLYHPIAAASEANNRIQHLVVAPRAGKENAFEFYNQAGEYDDDDYSGYICTYSTNNYLKVQTTPSGRSLFYTTIAEDGTATLEATDSDHTYKKLRYRAYSGGNTTSNRRFGCTSTITNEHDDICIYKIAGGKGVVPTPEAQFTVPAESSPVVIGKEGVAEATQITEVVFNYVGDWTISVSDNADWLTLNYADEKLTYTAPVNAGAKREATVTITASHDGKDDIEKTFKVVQKGEPQPISVKDFSALGVDANAEYLVTGVITKRVDSTSSDTEISDGKGNTAKFRYVYTADNKSSFYNTDANVEGNVVTILASKSYSASYGGSSSAHALCQGYYNLSAAADVDHVAYSGGDVKVTITKGGTLTPQTITGSVSELFAQLIYTENATEATVKLPANEGAPREVVATFTDGLATTSVTIIQGADTSKGTTWELVTDAATLEAGDKVIIAAKDYNVAMSTTISSNDQRGEAAVTKIGNYYLIPTALDVQTFVLGAGTEVGTFAFYDDTNKGFLVSSNTSPATLENQPYVDANASFAISIAEGAATIAKDSSKLAYYLNGTTKYFCSSSATSSYYNSLSLYRLVGVKGEIPVVAADVTVNDAVISEDAAVSATPIPEVVFNYVGDWDITATTDAEWITSLAFDKVNNCLTYTAEANLGAVRETTVTIIASLAGQTPISWNFGLLQKGFIPKMTIAEYNAIPEEDRSDNPYVRYELTGRIESIESTSATNSKFTITDGTESVQVYGLVVENSDKDYGDLNLKVGDVVTITAPRIANCDTAGKGSINPAYYISHYNIEATATAAEYTSGSTATISIATTSGLDVTYEMADCDFATISYTTDPTSENTTATVTFTSTNEAEVARSVDVTFTTGLASTTVTVTQKIDPAKVKGWVLVTDASELTIGDEVIIVAKNANYALGCYTSSSTSTANKNTSEVVINGTSISSEEVENKKVQKFTLVEGSITNTFAFEFTYNSSTYYLYANSGVKLYSNKNNGGRAFAIDIEADGNAIITSQGNTKYVITYNYKGSPAAFTTSGISASLATDVDADICIYKNTEK